MIFKKDGSWRPYTPDDIREISLYVEKNRDVDGHYDIVVEGETPRDDPQRAKEIVRGWKEAGATWWIEAMWASDESPNEIANGVDAVLERIRQGPPRES